VEKLLSIKKVSEATLRGKSTIWADLRAGTFPPPDARIGRRAAWLESTIQKWIADRVAETRQASPAARKLPIAARRAGKATPVKAGRP